MATGLSNQPKLLKGALVDTDLFATPPLIVPFQFNPETLTRRRSVRIPAPPSRRGREESTPDDQSLEAQNTVTEPETMSMDIRLDATDALERGDPVAAEYGVLPALSALELMITPRSETRLGGVVGFTSDFGFGDRLVTPVLIFVWGRQRLFPVRLTYLNIEEVEYNANLSPARVIVGVTLQVLSGGNLFQRYTLAQRTLLAALNARGAGAPDLARSIVPR
ncbi:MULTISPECIES: hypothetical protein [unclassified Streptosporangium]|uniref:hypothetical protein n=1 Tax=Streptosporangium sp. NPDC005286 TaxID=3154463 RepID=UPI0033B0322D